MMTTDEWGDTKRLIERLADAPAAERRTRWDILMVDVVPRLLEEVQQLRAEVAHRDERIGMLESATMFGLQEALRHLHDLPAEAEPAPPPPVAEPVEELDRVTEASITPARERRHDDRRLPRRLPRESSREERPAPPRLRREGVARSAEADSNRNVSLPNLARIRESKYLTPLGLSRLSGVSRQTIAKLECGEIDASPRMLRELAEGLGVEPSALTDWQAATA